VYLVDALADADDSLVLDVIAVLILGGEVAGVDLGLVVEVSYDLDGIGGVQHLDVVLVGGDHDAHAALGRLYQVVLPQSEQVLSRSGHALVHLQVVLVDADGVFIVRPDLSDDSIHLQYESRLAALCP
jgi:hypothetical protein